MENDMLSTAKNIIMLSDSVLGSIWIYYVKSKSASITEAILIPVKSQGLIGRYIFEWPYFLLWGLFKVLIFEGFTLSVCIVWSVMVALSLTIIVFVYSRLFDNCVLTNHYF